MPEMGWAGSTNGDLLHLAAADGFHALVTVDQGFEFQQNVSNLPIPVVIMIAARSRVQDLEPLIPEVIGVLSEQPQRRIYRVAA